RCALESLALRYRWVLGKLEELTGQPIGVIHVVGGGSQNELLCRLTADCCNRPVLAGPVEATAIGNVMVQAIGLGVLGSLSEAPAGWPAAASSASATSRTPTTAGRATTSGSSACSARNCYCNGRLSVMMGALASPTLEQPP